MVGLVLLTVVLFLSSLATVNTARIASYQRTGDTRKIVMNAIIGLGVDIAERSVREDAKTVVVTIAVRHSPGTYPAVAFLVPVLVALQDPLGDRAVPDQAGKAVRDVGHYLPRGVTPTP